MWFWALLVFTIALMPRLIHLVAVRDSPFLAVPIIDAWEHDTTAREMAAGRWLWQQPLFKAPGYLYWLAIVYVFSGGSMGAALVLQMLLGAYTCVAVFILGRRLLGLHGGLVAALLFAFYGVAIHHAAYLEIINLELPLCLTALWMMIGAAERRIWRLWLLAGILWGIAAATRPTVLFFIPLGLLWCYWQEKNLRLTVRWMAIFLAGIAVVIAPIALRNRLVLGESILISANGGINFYIGNNAEFNRTVSLQPGYEWQKLEREPVRLGLASNVSESQSWFYNKAWDYIRSHPLSWFKLLGRKLLLFLNARELSRNYSWDALRGESLVLRWPLIGFAFVLPLSIVSVYHRIRRRKMDSTLVLLGMFGLSILFVNVLYFPDSRYRLPLVPVLCILAADAMMISWDSWTRNKRKQVILSAIAALLLAGMMWLDPAGLRQLENWPQDFYVARIYHTLIGSAQQSGDAQTAEQYQQKALSGYRKAIQADPRNVDAYNNLASLLLARQENVEAMEVCRRGLAVDGEYMELLANLGLAEYRLGNFRESIEVFRKAAQASPGHLKVLYFLSRSQASAGDNEGAIETLKLAKEHGFSEWGALEQEPAFAVLLAQDGYKQLKY